MKGRSWLVLKAWDHEFNPESKEPCSSIARSPNSVGRSYADELQRVPIPFRSPTLSIRLPEMKDPVAAVKMLGNTAVGSEKTIRFARSTYSDTSRYKVGGVPKVDDVSVPGESGSGNIGIFPSMIFQSVQ